MAMAVAALFVVIDAALQLGLQPALASLAGDGTSAGDLARVAGVGALAANGVNNLPAYIALESVTSDAPARLMALLIGVNVAPLVTPWASLATLLWAQRCRARGIHISAKSLAVQGLLCAVVSAAWPSRLRWSPRERRGRGSPARVGTSVGRAHEAARQGAMSDATCATLAACAIARARARSRRRGCFRRRPPDAHRGPARRPPPSRRSDRRLRVADVVALRHELTWLTPSLGTVPGRARSWRRGCPEGTRCRVRVERGVEPRPWPTAASDLGTALWRPLGSPHYPWPWPRLGATARSRPRTAETFAEQSGGDGIASSSRARCRTWPPPTNPNGTRPCTRCASPCAGCATRCDGPRHLVRKPSRGRALSAAKAVQELLGEHHDAVVSLSLLRGLAVAERDPARLASYAVLFDVETTARDRALATVRAAWPQPRAALPAPLSRIRGISLGRPQPSLQVLDEVADVLEADRDPDRAVGDARPRRVPPASSRRCVVVAGWVISDLASPRLLRDVDDRQGVHQRERLVLATVDLEGHDRAAAAAIWRRASSCCGWRVEERVHAPVVHRRVLPLLERARRRRARRSASRSTRSVRVSRPLISTQALNGDIDGPVCRIRFLHRPVDELARCRAPRRRACGPGRRCAWSPSRRRCRRRARAACENTGVPKTLSTTTCAPAAWASSQTAAMSTSSCIGLLGVSKNTAGGRHRQRLAPLVEVGAVDEDGLDPPARQDLVEDHEARPEQRPRRHDPVALRRSSAASATKTADIPDAVAKHASAPSSRRSRSSNIVTVGLP